MPTRFCILGTAGHIDHGKSSLVKALTGTDPDRLPEEKARGMTIELGFAHLLLPAEAAGADVIEVGIVDVPGHERFIRTMVAGATGIDLAMLVVAADDGVMPQTREHVEVLDLLGVSRGLVAITKSDLVEVERVDEVREQVRALVGETALRNWPMVACSAKTEMGLGSVRDAIRTLAVEADRRARGDVFRLAIDRVFAVHGRGTVVTGSVLSGSVSAGATLEVQPAGVACRVREVQSHGAMISDAAGGQRAALNLTGIERDFIERGMELATPGYLTKSRYVDGRVRVLPRLEGAVPSHCRVRVCMGTREAMAMLVVLGGDAIEPGEMAFVQLRFLAPITASFGQRFIVRNETAQWTIGGGEVVRPVSRRVRPKDAEVVALVKRAASEDSRERLEEALLRAGFEPRANLRLACETGIEPVMVETLRRELEKCGRLIRVGGAVVHVDALGAIEGRALAYLNRHHHLKPGEPGIPKDRLIGWIEARTGAGIGKEIFARLESRGAVVVRGPYVAHAGFQPAMSPEDAETMARIVEEITRGGFDPPPWGSLKSVESLSKARAKALEDLAKTDSRLVAIGAGAYISREALDQFDGVIRALGTAGRRFKLAEVRDRLNLSRRVVQPLLEYLDRVRMTKRVGDERVLTEPG